MKARLITRFKDVTPEGGVIELVVWRVPEPVRPSEHGFKYRAAFAIEAMATETRYRRERLLAPFEIASAR